MIHASTKLPTQPTYTIVGKTENYFEIVVILEYTDKNYHMSLNEYYFHLTLKIMMVAFIIINND